MNNILVGTSNYRSGIKGNTVSITGDGGNAWGYYGQAYKKLAPSLKLINYYMENPDRLSREQLIRVYIRAYYERRLRNLDCLELLNIFNSKFGKGIVLLCHEDIDEFCHRFLVADFLELNMNIRIPELGIVNDKVVELDRKSYKRELKRLIW